MTTKRKAEESNRNTKSKLESAVESARSWKNICDSLGAKVEKLTCELDSVRRAADLSEVHFSELRIVGGALKTQIDRVTQQRDTLTDRVLHVIEASGMTNEGDRFTKTKLFDGIDVLEELIRERRTDRSFVVDWDVG